MIEQELTLAHDLATKAFALSTATLNRRNAQDVARLLPTYIRAIQEFFASLKYEVSKQFYLSLGKEPPKIEKAEQVSSEFMEWREFEEEAILLLTLAHLRIMEKSGNRMYGLAGITGKFDVERPEPVERARNRTKWFVALLIAESIRRIRNVVERAKREGWNVDRINRELRWNVGLSTRQVRGLENYRQKLIDSGATDSKITREMEKESRRRQKQREFTIARTETAKARADGEIMAAKEKMIQYVQYITTGDPCPICAPFEGMIYSVAEADGLIPQHQNCLCSFWPVVSEDFTILEEEQE